METLKRLSTKLPTSIGVVTHRISSHQVGEVPSLGASRHGASTEVPSMCLALNLLITFKQRTRTMFISVECNVIKFILGTEGLDLTHILEAQRPMLIMKKKLTHTLRYLPVGSIPMRKGSTLLSNEGYFHLWLPIWGPPRCTQNSNRLWAICIS